MLNNLFNRIERITSLGTSGPWWWRIVGGGISLAVLIAVVVALGHLK